MQTVTSVSNEGRRRIRAPHRDTEPFASEARWLLVESRLTADSGELEDTPQLDLLTIALPPARIAARARAQANVVALEREVDTDQLRNAADRAGHLSFFPFSGPSKATLSIGETPVRLEQDRPIGGLSSRREPEAPGR